MSRDLYDYSSVKSFYSFIFYDAYFALHVMRSLNVLISADIAVNFMFE